MHGEKLQDAKMPLLPLRTCLNLSIFLQPKKHYLLKEILYSQCCSCFLRIFFFKVVLARRTKYFEIGAKNNLEMSDFADFG